MRISLSVLSIATALNVFGLLGLTVNASSAQLTDRGSGRITHMQADRGSGRITYLQADRGSGRITNDSSYRGSGRITNVQAYRGSGRLVA